MKSQGVKVLIPSIKNGKMKHLKLDPNKFSVSS